MNSTKVTIATKKRSKCYVVFSNTTSLLDCLAYKDISLLIAQEEELTLIVPIRSCAKGDRISLYIFENDKFLRKLKRLPEDRTLLGCEMINGIIEQHDKVTDQLAEVMIRITDNSGCFVDKITKRIESRQENVSLVFKRYRS